MEVIDVGKQWKNMKGYYFDIGNRDAPCILYDNTLYVGNFNDTHTSLIQKVIYGMNNEDGVLPISEDSYLGYSRSDISEDFDEEYILYGNLCGDNIYWDVYSKNLSISEMRKLVCDLPKDKYNHYRLGNTAEGRKAIRLRRKGGLVYG